MGGEAGAGSEVINGVFSSGHFHSEWGHPQTYPVAISPMPGCIIVINILSKWQNPHIGDSKKYVQCKNFTWPICYFLVDVYFREGNNHWLAPRELTKWLYAPGQSLQPTYMCLLIWNTRKLWWMFKFPFDSKMLIFSFTYNLFLPAFFPRVVKMEIYWAHIYFLYIITE